MNELNFEKPKSIIIDGSLHKRLKSRCRSRGLKIGSIVEDLIYTYLKDTDTLQKIIEKNREEK